MYFMELFRSYPLPPFSDRVVDSFEIVLFNFGWNWFYRVEVFLVCHYIFASLILLAFPYGVALNPLFLRNPTVICMFSFSLSTCRMSWFLLLGHERCPPWLTKSGYRYDSTDSLDKRRCTGQWHRPYPKTVKYCNEGQTQQSVNHIFNLFDLKVHLLY